MAIASQKAITRARILEMLEYKSETGDLIWKPSKNRGHWRVAGKPAGGFNNGYRRVTIDAFSYYVLHNLIWLIETGGWPENEIDHKNRDRSDNRFSNLRIATAAQNVMNRNAHSNNVIGIKGVSLFKSQGWRARIQVDGKPVFLGYFSTKEDAAAAYAKAAKALHGEFANPTMV